jgi:hypothetical protein
MHLLRTYVAENQAKIAEPDKKVLDEELRKPTADDARKLAEKLLPSLCRILISQELVFEFVHELLWKMEVAEVTDAEEGLEIPRISQEDFVEAKA